MKLLDRIKNLFRKKSKKRIIDIVVVDVSVNEDQVEVKQTETFRGEIPLQGKSHRIDPPHT